MKNKTVSILIGVSLITAVTYFITKKLSKKSKSKLKYLMSEGEKYYKEKDYTTAILFYTRCLSLTQDINLLLELYNSLSYCNIKLKEYPESIKYLDKSLSIKIVNNHKALKWRSECYKLQGMDKEYLKDLLLYYSLVKDEEVKKQGEVVMKKICEDETRKINKWVKMNDIEYSELCKTLVSMVDECKGIIVNLIRENRYTELDSYVRDGWQDIKNKEDAENEQFNLESEQCDLKNEKEIFNIIKSLILFHKGKLEEALKNLAKSKSKYSNIIRDYMKSCKNSIQAKLDYEVDKTNVTCLYYAYKSTKDFKYLEQALNLCFFNLKYDFVYYTLIMYYIDQESYDKVEEIISKLEIEKSPSLIELMTEYYIKFKEFNKAEKLLSIEVLDPRVSLARALYSIEIGKTEQARNILSETIKKYPDFYKAYLYLGNLLFHDDISESGRIFTKALDICASYDEVFMTQQALLLVEVQEHIKNNLG